MIRRLAVPALLALALAPGLAAKEAVPTIRLADVTEASGLAGARGDRFSFGDYDGDGDPDLLVQGRALWRNDTEGRGRPDARIRFTDVTRESGIGQGGGGGAVWVDLDGDGDLDVVTTSGALKIQHAPGLFRDESAARGVALDKQAASVGVGDLDGDGRTDLLFGGGEDWNDGNAVYHPRRLFLNVEGRAFRQDTAQDALSEGRYGRAVVLADHDQDGDLDAYLGNYRLQANQLLVNERGRLADRAEDAGVAGRFTKDRGAHPTTKEPYGYHYGHTIAASWADLDGDGDLDLWVSNLVHKYVGPNDAIPGGFDMRGWICDDSAIYENQGAPSWTFRDRRATSGIPLMPTGGRGEFRGDELWSHAAMADLDGDGLPEVLVTQVYDLPYSHALLFRNQGAFAFDEVSADLGIRRFDSYGGAFADVDGDGDPDLVMNGRAEPKGEAGVRLFRNETPPGPWAAFRVLEPTGTAPVIGAEVLLETDAGPLKRHVEGAMGSHAQQSEGVLRFGLRGRTAVRAWVRWPGGHLQRIDAPKPGRVHDVRRPARELPPFEIRATEDETTGLVRLEAKGKKPTGCVWTFELRGDGDLDVHARGSAATLRARGPVEVRVRLLHERRGEAREVVWRGGPRD